MSEYLPAHVLFFIMHTDPASAYHRLNNLFEYPSVINHLMELLSIIVVDILMIIRMLTCVDDGTILACYFINVPDMEAVDAS